MKLTKPRLGVGLETTGGEHPNVSFSALFPNEWLSRLDAVAISSTGVSFVTYRGVVTRVRRLRREQFLGNYCRERQTRAISGDLVGEAKIFARKLVHSNRAAMLATWDYHAWLHCTLWPHSQRKIWSSPRAQPIHSQVL